MPDPPANPNSRRFNHEMWLGEEPWQRITAARRVNWPPQAQTLITEYDARQVEQHNLIATAELVNLRRRSHHYVHRTGLRIAGQRPPVLPARAEHPDLNGEHLDQIQLPSA